MYKRQVQDGGQLLTGYRLVGGEGGAGHALHYAPDQAITREQLASILYRYAKWLGFSGYGSDISGYTDAGKVSSYAYDAMSWAVRSGVVTGTSARVLDPQEMCIRDSP